MPGSSPASPAGSPRVDITATGPVTVLTLTDEPRRNAFGAQMRDQLHQALQAAAADPAVRAVVLTGAGSAFSAGGDLAAMPPPTRAEGEARMGDVGDLVRFLAGLDKPVIAAVRGPAAGVAVGLACVSDLVIAADDARFLFPFTRLGLVPDGGLLHSLSQRVGPARARRIALLAQTLDAREALETGLADEVVPAEDLLSHALSRAAELAARAPLAVAAVKQGMRENTASLEATLRFEQQRQPVLFETDDFREGKAAFFERRDPTFSGY